MVVIAVLVVVPILTLAGCAKHADFVEVREQLSKLSKSQEQDHKRLEGIAVRLESVDRVKDLEPNKQRLSDASALLQKIESRLAKLEEAASQVSVKADGPSQEHRPPKIAAPAQVTESGASSTPAQGILPAAAFNLAYNDYLSGRYELASVGFQRFIKDFTGSVHAASAQYWLGESYYNLKDYGHAIPIFEFFVTEYPGHEKTPVALYRIGVAAAETGDLIKSRKNLKRVLEEFPGSSESRLAKSKLAEIR